ncbi:MAG: YigZ family protein [Victivallales bacterium]|nr:YigZ family protein [Victivallales bacterium]
MLVLVEEARAELVVKRSRFIAELIGVDSQEAARETLRLRKEAWANSGINHLVHAFITGPGANVMGCSDDGEPAGTAGRPALEVLKGSGLTNVLLTIARYFGGIKLGTGGLVKAYTDVSKAVLEVAVTRELVPMTTFILTCNYAVYERIRRILQDNEATIDSEDFGVAITFHGTMREAAFANAAEQCRDATRGESTLTSVP